MAAAKKSSFYHTRNKICPNKAQAAELLNVEIADIERMDANGEPLGEMVLRFWDKKHIGLPGWDGWLFSQGVLAHKNKRWRPENLLYIKKNDEVIHQLEVEINQLYTINGLIKIAKYIIISKHKKWRN